MSAAPQYTIPPSPPKSMRNTWLVIILAVVVVMAVVLAFLAFYHAGTVSITLMSDHVLNTVDIVVTCDGRVCLQGQLAPLQSSTNDWSVTWFGASCKTVTVVATSTGGGLGSQTDSASGSLCGGEHAAVFLTV